MIDNDVAIAAALITFSGIAATLAVQLTSKRVRTPEQLTHMAVLSVCALLFVLATILPLLYLLGICSRAALTGSSWLALLSMLVLLGFLFWFVPLSLLRGWRIKSKGSPQARAINKQARKLA